MLQKLKCYLGFHRWRAVHSEFTTVVSPDPSYELVPEFEICKFCYKDKEEKYWPYLKQVIKMSTKCSIGHRPSGVLSVVALVASTLETKQAQEKVIADLMAKYPSETRESIITAVTNCLGQTTWRLEDLMVEVLVRDFNLLEYK